MFLRSLEFFLKVTKSHSLRLHDLSDIWFYFACLFCSPVSQQSWEVIVFLRLDSLDIDVLCPMYRAIKLEGASAGRL